MCRALDDGGRRCPGHGDSTARRAARREDTLRERGYDGEVDPDFAAGSVAVRAERAADHPEATFDPSPSVRAARARAGDLTEDEEDMLSGDDSPRVRAGLARNPVTSPGVLEVLAADEDQQVRAAVAAHPSTPPHTLAAMAEGLDRRRDLAVAQALAANPNTPAAALEAWQRTGTGGWRTLARAALRDRAEAGVTAAAGAVLSGTERAGAGIEATMAGSEDALDDVFGQRSAKVG